MTNRAQFEAMLEALINDDQETAKEIFHNIVVGKSREIYEELLESDFQVAEGENPFADDTGTPKAHSADEEGEEEEEDSDDAEGDDTEADDADDEEGEEEPFGDEEGDEEEGGEDIEDRVMDLEDALEDLKAEFEQLMADEENEPEHYDGMDDPEFGGDDMDMDAGEPDMMMEYVNKVPNPAHGDNGNNTQSIVAKPNRMGGSAGNIAQSFSTTSGGTQGGLAAPTAKVEDFGNVNKPGANAGKTAFKKKEPGHGAEKKGAAPGGNVGAETGKNSRDGEKNTTSVISKRVR